MIFDYELPKTLRIYGIDSKNPYISNGIEKINDIR